MNSVRDAIEGELMSFNDDLGTVEEAVQKMGRALNKKERARLRFFLIKWKAYRYGQMLDDIHLYAGVHEEQERLNNLSKEDEEVPF